VALSVTEGIEHRSCHRVCLLSGVGAITLPAVTGTLARLRLQPPEGSPIEVETIVWRTDEDGSAFFFIDGSRRGSQPSE
jgi:hypothetical protein